MSSDRLDARQAMDILPWVPTFGCGALKVAMAATAMLLPLTSILWLPDYVGLLLLAGGGSELSLSLADRRTWLGRLAIGSGAATLLLGVVFISGRWSGFFPLAQLVTAWLLIRGLFAFDAGLVARVTDDPNWRWLVVRGVTDTTLGVAMLLCAPLLMITYPLFGVTREIVSLFAALLAISFAVGGISLMAIGLYRKKRAQLCS